MTIVTLVIKPSARLRAAPIFQTAEKAVEAELPLLSSPSKLHNGEPLGSHSQMCVKLNDDLAKMNPGRFTALCALVGDTVS